MTQSVKIRKIPLCSVFKMALGQKIFAIKGTSFFKYSTFVKSNLPNHVKIVEVSARDGLQNEPKFVPTKVKVDLIQQLADSGLKSIEVTSFVSPKWVPQMADQEEVYKQLRKKPEVSYPVLIPNEKGFQKAKELGIREIAVFTAASEAFCKKNTNCTIDESFKRFESFVEKAMELKMRVRGYVSCVVGCPYQKQVSPVSVAQVTKRLYEMGCYEVSLGDTIGVGTPGSVSKMFDEVLKVVPPNCLAMHFHDTYGQALSNILCGLHYGISVVDSSVAGLGGCPYAKGASGNVATEDLVYMLNGMNISTGVDLNRLILAGRFITSFLLRDNLSKVSLAMSKK